MISKHSVNSARPPHPTSSRLPIGIDEEPAEEGQIASKLTGGATGHPDALPLHKVQHRVARRWVDGTYVRCDGAIDYFIVNRKVAVTQSIRTIRGCGVGEEVGASDGYGEFPSAGAVGSPFVGGDAGELDAVGVSYNLIAALAGVEAHVE